MRNNERAMKMANVRSKNEESRRKTLSGFSAGGALRDRLLNKITPILIHCDFIQDADTRLSIQANCLDLVTALEDLIHDYELDQYPVVD